MHGINIQFRSVRRNTLLPTSFLAHFRFTKQNIRFRVRLFLYVEYAQYIRVEPLSVWAEGASALGG